MNFNFEKDPFDNFQVLFKQAQLKGIPEHHAMSIATVNDKNEPSNRIVYYKGMIRGGFSFYTNYNGRKGQDLLNNPNICSNFFWPHLDTQVRITGQAYRLTEIESDQYFSTRARLNQIGAWASLQSQELKSFAEFQNRIKEFENKFAGLKIPRPPHWGGFRIIPSEIEFWFMRDGRLHERYIYSSNLKIDSATAEKINNVFDYSWSKKLRFP